VSAELFMAALKKTIAFVRARDRGSAARVRGRRDDRSMNGADA